MESQTKLTEIHGDLVVDKDFAQCVLVTTANRRLRHGLNTIVLDIDHCQCLIVTATGLSVTLHSSHLNPPHSTPLPSPLVVASWSEAEPEVRFPDKNAGSKGKHRSSAQPVVCRCTALTLTILVIDLFLRVCQVKRAGSCRLRQLIADRAENWVNKARLISSLYGSRSFRPIRWRPTTLGSPSHPASHPA